MRYFYLHLLLLFSSYSAISQYTISGKISDENNNPLAECHVHIQNKNAISHQDGKFSVFGIPKGKNRLLISYIGYETIDTTVVVTQNLVLDFKMKTSVSFINEVVVKSDGLEQKIKKESAQHVEIINQGFIEKNINGSLMQSLEKIGGINTISIGSGQSKPIIRGLGFNRVVVTENGVKHEGQQWGSDHGLEIDQYAVDQVQIIKGPASLQYGSDAIGGIIVIEKNKIPKKNTFGGSLTLTGKTNNELFGSSLNVFKRKESLFFDTRITYNDYADYKVPTDHISIYSYRAPLYKNRLRNTAGNELNLHFSTGILKDKFSSVFYISNLKTKTGLFANAHGLEPRNVDTELHDASDRDIQNPSQNINHFKVINRTKLNGNTFKLEFDLGFQNNFREEYSDYISHGYMPSNYPETLAIKETLERGFNKNVYSFNGKISFTINKHAISSGINTEHQNNSIGGWGFIIPAYTQTNAGLFMYDKFKITKKTILHTGIRYDYGTIKTKSYYDWFTTPVNGNNEYLQRANTVKKNFGNISWSFGINYNSDYLLMRANIGKSFRIPIAKELASNGVNYHQFSYELGNPDLSPEESYQLDLGATWQKNKIYVDINPFLNYFSNYIYLNPTPEYDYAYGAGNQIYEYTESRVLRYGGELKIDYNFNDNYTAGIVGEYVYSEQLSGVKKGYTLPFSPPPSVLLHFTYSKDFGQNIQNTFASVDLKYVTEQNNIVPPENKTPDYHVINLGLGSDIVWGTQKVNIRFQIQNVFNKKYFNHTSFYRLIGVPEPGRNFVLFVKIPF
ncbi:TonB-dependent receptor [Flavobacterium sediminis]|uniref:TonB-dependent receptor n=1 Tax=Flavobacterium sediminis TaxID=2201181 RepID=A0A2U8QTM0_9FLAO|nr:TonB-dependent receptor [Flavobacterium sediminis]AWM13429.1 TonB-dependent receptor [Flavobacterium sediminis]